MVQGCHLVTFLKYFSNSTLLFELYVYSKILHVLACYTKIKAKISFIFHLNFFFQKLFDVRMLGRFSLIYEYVYFLNLLLPNLIVIFFNLATLWEELVICGKRSASKTIICYITLIPIRVGVGGLVGVTVELPIYNCCFIAPQISNFVVSYLSWNRVMPTLLQICRNDFPH